MVEGLRISPEPPTMKHDLIQGTKQFDNAIIAYQRDGNLDKVKERVNVSPELEKIIIKAATT